MLPNDIVCLFKRRAVGGDHQFLAGSHKVGHYLVHAHAGQAVVALGNNAQEFAVGRAIGRNRHGGMSALLLEGHHLLEGVVGGKVRI